MKKGIFSVIILFCCSLVFSGCIKNTPYVTTINPYLTASIGTYAFTSATVVPATVDSQLNDTSTALYITGNSSDVAFPHDRIVLWIQNYKGLTGVKSIVAGSAGAYYVHDNNPPDLALGGIVAITKITSNSITGYFNFNTASGLVITNGLFTVGKP